MKKIFKDIMNLDSTDSVQIMLMSQKFLALINVLKNMLKPLKKINTLLKNLMFYLKMLKLFKLKL